MATIHPVTYNKDEWDNLYDSIEFDTNLNLFVFNEFMKIQYFNNKQNNIENKLKSFITKIQINYKNNHYHNYKHAIHVFKSSIVIWKQLCNRVCFDFNNIDHIALLIAAFIHDVCHPGGFNSLLIGINNEIANTYNDQSILENQSLKFAFDLLNNEDTNFLCNLSNTEFKEFRKTVIELVLGTDIGNQVRNAYLDSISNSHIKQFGMIDTDKQEGRIIAMTYILRCADVSAGMQSINISWLWAERFYSECYIKFNGPPGSITDTYTNQIIHIKNNSLKLVQQIIQLKILNQSFEENILSNITTNLHSWKENAQINILTWKDKLSNNNNDLNHSPIS